MIGGLRAGRSRSPRKAGMWKIEGRLRAARSAAKAVAHQIDHPAVTLRCTKRSGANVAERQQSGNLRPGRIGQVPATSGHRRSCPHATPHRLLRVCYSHIAIGAFWVKSWSNLFGLAGAALGVIALALPFTGHLFEGVSPIEVLWHDADSWAQMLAGSALLSIPIAFWQLRRLSSSTPLPFEIALAYVSSTTAMLPVLALSTQYAWYSWGQPEQAISCGGLVACWGLATSSGILLVRNIRRRIGPHVTAEVFLLGGYLPNAVYALVLFYPFYGGLEKDPHGLRHLFISTGWSVGAYVVLATCIALVVRIVVLLNSHESYPPQPRATADAQQAARRSALH